jgi:hypothetical protein
MTWLDKSAAVSARIVPWDGAIGVGYVLPDGKRTAHPIKADDWPIIAPRARGPAELLERRGVRAPSGSGRRHDLDRSHGTITYQRFPWQSEMSRL